MAFQVTSSLVDLCRAIKCESCGKTTWTGCGKHIETALKDVKEEDRCHCKDAPTQTEPAAEKK